MNEKLQEIILKLKSLWQKWTLVQKAILGGIVLLVVVGIVAVARISSVPTVVPVFGTAVSDENLRDRIIVRANSENISVSSDSNGMLFVRDDATARKLRAVLVREDLVPGNLDPWALFDVQRWTITDFERNVNLRRAITDEVRKLIEALDDVDSANVVINMPEKQLFASEQSPVTASVIIVPKPGSDISSNKKKIQGIEKLVQFAVSGLKSEFVTIADQNGATLNDWENYESDSWLDSVSRGQKLINQIEANYRAKVLAALQATFSADRVRDLNVKVEMDMSKQQIDATEYSPIVISPDNPDTPYDDSKIVESIPLSTEIVDKTFEGRGINPEGPAGIEGQNPPVYSDSSMQQGKWHESGKKENNAVSSRQIHSEKTPAIDRITVSVNIDGTWEQVFDEKGERIWENGVLKRKYTPIPADVLAQVTRQVENAVGCNKIRGDSVVVTNIQFDRTEEFRKSDGALLDNIQLRLTILRLVGIFAALTILLIALRIVMKRLEERRRRKEEELLRKNQMERERALWEAEQKGMEVTMSVEEQKQHELIDNVLSAAKDNPEDVAQLIRTWLLEE